MKRVTKQQLETQLENAGELLVRAGDALERCDAQRLQYRNGAFVLIAITVIMAITTGYYGYENAQAQSNLHRLVRIIQTEPEAFCPTPGPRIEIVPTPAPDQQVVPQEAPATQF